MKNGLAYDLSRMTLASGEGAFLTRAQRHAGLQLIARELRGLGFQLPGAGSLKGKHVTALVTKWQADGRAVGTIKNRMAWIRTWGSNARKRSVLPRTNADVGVGRRVAYQGNRAKTAIGAQLAALPERMALAVRLQMAFGLRLEESLKFRPRVADKGDTIALQASWCKGGRARSISLTHGRQRELLDEIRSLCGDGSLIPDGVQYIAYRKEFERVAGSVGIHNMHGHRHWYAQWRYRVLTGRAAPASGGPPAGTLNRREQAADYRARLQISRELGHVRIEITNTYLGYRSAGGGRTR